MLGCPRRVAPSCESPGLRLTLLSHSPVWGCQRRAPRRGRHDLRRSAQRPYRVRDPLQTISLHKIRFRVRLYMYEFSIRPFNLFNSQCLKFNRHAQDD